MVFYPESCLPFSVLLDRPEPYGVPATEIVPHAAARAAQSGCALLPLRRTLTWVDPAPKSLRRTVDQVREASGLRHPAVATAPWPSQIPSKFCRSCSRIPAPHLFGGVQPWHPALINIGLIDLPVREISNENIFSRGKSRAPTPDGQ